MQRMSKQDEEDSTGVVHVLIDNNINKRQQWKSRQPTHRLARGIGVLQIEYRTLVTQRSLSPL